MGAPVGSNVSVVLLVLVVLLPTEGAAVALTAVGADVVEFPPKTVGVDVVAFDKTGAAVGAVVVVVLPSV